ncbi:magnesium transporter CorA family protein [Streptococcus uberis]|uniref:magnesium transporter CorA family protein n=1 Tax=Streptococcus uberis TaxID=1349 RepID=UPI001FF5557C|nr:magnesium transporter CorA family protein [Streptococcus uberis]MCK1231744.1 magnesium transporter CorA family protein [Streptococcus uberis]
MSRQESSESHVLFINSDQLEESRQALSAYDFLDDEVLAYASDENETSFVEETNGRLTVVYQLLDYQEVSITKGLLDAVTDSVDMTQAPKHILFQYLTLFTKGYFHLMEDLTKERDHLIQDLRKRPTKRNLKGLANLQSGSVYVMMGSKQNSDMISDFEKLPSFEASDDQVKEQLRDTQIEARQLSNMISLHARILEQLASSYNNVLSNNLNENVTTLTIISIGISILATVTSFYGMNVKLPFAKHDPVWAIILLVTSLVAIVAIFVMIRYVKKEHDHSM